MGYVRVKVKIRNIHNPELEVERELLADTGSIYTMIKREFLEELQIEPRGQAQIQNSRWKTRRTGGWSRRNRNKRAKHILNNNFRRKHRCGSAGGNNP